MKATRSARAAVEEHLDAQYRDATIIEADEEARYRDALDDLERMHQEEQDCIWSRVQRRARVQQLNASEWRDAIREAGYMDDVQIEREFERRLADDEFLPDLLSFGGVYDTNPC